MVSKVNQCTLLAGMLPRGYAIALGAAEPLPRDARKAEEILLTAAQPRFAVALLLDRRLSLAGTGLRFALFLSRAHLLATFRRV